MDSPRVDNYQADLFVNMTKDEVIEFARLLKRSQEKLYDLSYKASKEEFDAAISVWYDHRDLLNDLDIEIIRRMH